MADQEDPAWTPDEETQQLARELREKEHRNLLAQLEQEHAEYVAKHGPEMRRLLVQQEHTLCQKVQQLREERGWSQAELARRLSDVGFEMHQTTVAKLEAGKRPLRVAETFALAEVFGLPPLVMFAMPVQGEDRGMAYMRERLKIIDDLLEKTREQITQTLEDFAKTYAEYSAERTWMAEAMRRAAAEQAKGDNDGEHQEKT